MKRIILAALLASSMLAAVPLRAADVNWQRPAYSIDTIYSWSDDPSYWWGGELPGPGDFVGFDPIFPGGGDIFPTTVNYDVSTSIRFGFIDVSNASYASPLTLQLDAPYTLSVDTVRVQADGTLALYGGTLSTSVEYILHSGYILQTEGENTISQILDIIGGAYNLVDGVLNATREWIESAGKFFQSGGTNTVGSTLVVDGTFTQDGGYTNTDALTIGESGVGTYFLRGGSLYANTETFGNLSAGIFTQSGGTNTAGTLLVGSQAYGTYNLSGGTLESSNLEINNGIFNQSRGTSTLGTAWIGMTDGFTGRYDFSGGVLSANAVFVGNHGPGNFLHTGGTSNVNELTIGANGATGTYRLEGTGLVGSPARLAAGVEYIGYSGTGAFDHYGSNDSVHTAGRLYIGYDTGGNGTYTMHGNVLLEAGDEVVGRAGNGSFTQHMGTHRIGAVTLNPGEAPVGGGTLTLGELLGGTGVYSMNPTVGIPELWASTEVIGNYGTGTFTQFGGTNTVAGDLYLGRYATGVGNFTLIGSESTIQGVHTPATELTAVNEYIGDVGSGSFTHSGGNNPATVAGLQAAPVSGGDFTRRIYGRRGAGPAFEMPDVLRYAS